MAEVIKSKAKTAKELKRELRSLKPFKQELQIGKECVMSTGDGYGVRASWDKSDIMTDYCAHIFGFREKQVVDSAVRHNRVKDDRATKEKANAKTTKKKR